MRRPAVLTATAVTATGLLGASLAAPPGSARFFRLTAATATAWTGGGLASAPVPVGRGSVAAPVALGAAAFGGFYVAALVARRIPVLRTALRDVLRYAGYGDDPSSHLPAQLTTLANGVGEEVFFRGALYTALDGRPRPVLTSTLVYALCTTATRNPALVLAALVMGTLFGLQRRTTGGVLAPLLTHTVWSALMLRFMPPLFRSEE